MINLSRPRDLLLVLTPCAYLIIWVISFAIGLKLNLVDLVNPVMFTIGSAILVSLAATKFKMFALRATVECVSCGLLLSIPVTVSTYVAMRFDLPLADAQLASWDSALGVDWLSLMRWIDERESVASLLNHAYRTFSYQLLIWPVVLVALNRSERAYQMICAYALICFLSSALSILWPALGTYTYYDFDATTLKNIDQTYGYFFLEQFHAVRDNPDFVWSLQGSAGIITFPSVHAAIAVLCAWALWDVRLLRYPALLLNVAMAFSAVPGANHYVVDVIAGCFVALWAIAAITALTRYKSYTPPRRIDLAASPG
ncbi:phosphatase PAP2 family protein [Rhizobium sp. ZW T2_16]|uniref:phosphatase PAP2 family protein n=1 Tax=Rhizobium sp. ZW T2_16 TaxID=3378083 RepID=UPI003851C943